MLAPVWGSILCTGLGDLPREAGAPPSGGVKARMGFPISTAGLDWTAGDRAQGSREADREEALGLLYPHWPLKISPIDANNG